MSNTEKRILAGLALGVLAFLSPGWLFIAVGALFSWKFSHYYEFVVFGFFVDVLWGTETSILGGFLFTAISLGMVMGIKYTKRRMRLLP